MSATVPAPPGRRSERLPFFVYGTLRPGESNYAGFLGGRTVAEEPVRMRGAVLYDGPGYPYAVAAPESPGAEIHGDLVLPAAEHYGAVLAGLDHLEGYAAGAADNLYERVTGQVVRADGTTAPAWVYFAAAPLAARLRASGRAIAGGDWRAARAAGSGRPRADTIRP